MSKNNSKNLANKGPNPNTKTPLEGYEDLVFLKNIITSPNIHAGDYTYYDDRRYSAKNFEENNVLYKSLCQFQHDTSYEEVHHRLFLA